MNYVPVELRGQVLQEGEGSLPAEGALTQGQKTCLLLNQVTKRINRIIIYVPYTGRFLPFP